MASYIRVLAFMSVFVFNISHTKPSCVQYEFRGIPGNTVTASEHEVLNITFSMNNKCLIHDIRSFTTEVKSSDKNLLCSFKHSQGLCRLFGHDCHCPEDSSSLYWMAMHVRRSHAGNLTWVSTTGAVTDSTHLNIVVNYPPALKSLTVLSPVVQNASVAIACTWDRGNPPTNSTPQLFDGRGKELSGSVESSTVSYTMDSVQCDDAGEIVCKDSTGDSLSETLLVKCAPQFLDSANETAVHSVETGSDVHLKFSLRSHSKDIDHCQFQQVIHSNMGPQRVKPCRNKEMSGTPPYLTFLVSFPDASPSDNGLQRLVLSNDIGSGHVEFEISVTDSKESDLHFAQTPFGIFLVVVNAGIVAAVIFRIIWKQRGRFSSLCGRCTPNGNRAIPMAVLPARCGADRVAGRQVPEADDQQAASRGSIDTSSSSNTYESVSDDDISSVTGSHLCVANTESDSTEDDYYLNPVATVKEVFESKDETP